MARLVLPGLVLVPSPSWRALPPRNRRRQSPWGSTSQSAVEPPRRPPTRHSQGVPAGATVGVELPRRVAGPLAGPRSREWVTMNTAGSSLGLSRCRVLHAAAATAPTRAAVRAVGEAAAAAAAALASAWALAAAEAAAAAAAAVAAAHRASCAEEASRVPRAWTLRLLQQSAARQPLAAVPVAWPRALCRVSLALRWMPALPGRPNAPAPPSSRSARPSARSSARATRACPSSRCQCTSRNSGSV
mmetsp:Transcript_10320/g.30603  ORF Transcript_10320/g.30603 Transcript_10320/m.30603 type:complete len:245 (+) Transcript_10320:377-1111(+)